MGSSETTAAGVDSDGSVSWEDFFGTSTDLVPQLLGMFDELARKDEVNNHMNDQIPQSIQKRLSLVAVHSQRNTIFGQISPGKTEQQQQQQQQQSPTSAMQQQKLDKEKNRASIEPSLEYRAAPPPPLSPPPPPPPPPPRLSFPSSTSFPSAKVEITVSSEKEISPKKASHINDDDDDDDEEEENDNDDDDEGGDKNNTLTPKYGGRRRRRNNIDRPLSIGSSTSSSGCSNQGNNGTANPYLTSVESLADTCASSQGSGDSGVVTTTSEINRRLINNVKIDKSPSHKVTIDPPFSFHRARYCDPQRNPVEKVLLEIVDTEAIYVEHLRQVIQGYLIYWRNDKESLLQESELNNLFSNIEDIYKFNHEFLNEIENYSMDPIKISQTFTKRNSGFKIYTEYCTNYPRTVETLTNLMSNNDTAKEFRQRQAALCHALPLGSFLLKPVQRILKYHLLLDSLSREYDAINLQYYGDKVEGKKSINDALNGMMNIAKHINAMKRKHEHAVRVQVIQSLLYGWPGPDLTTSGELVAEGRFRMRGAKAPRHAFLFERMLLLTKQKEDGLLVYKAHIMCSNLMLIESIPGEPCSFHVIPFDNPRLQYTLQARNSEQKREWTLQIKRVMLENYNAVIPMNSRQLLLQIGQTQQDDETTNCDKISMKKQYSSPPEYLERRKLDKERRRSEAGLRQKGKKLLKSETADNSPLPSRKIDLNNQDSRDCSLNRSFDGRASKVKDRFTNWRRKSEPGFQSYVSLNQSDEEQIDCTDVQTEVEEAIEALEYEINEEDNLKPEEDDDKNNINTKDVNEQQKPPRTMEEIVGHILMQNQEFQKLLEKQRNNSMTNVRQQQRFNKHQNSVDTSDDSDNAETNYPTDNSSNNNSNNINNNNSNNLSLSINSSNNNNNNNNNTKGNRATRLSRRENRLIRSNNNWNSLSSPQSRDNISNLRLQYNNLKIDNDKSQTIDNTSSKIKTNRVYEKQAIFENFKRQSIVTQSKIIKTALRIRENSPSNEEIHSNVSDKPKIVENNDDKNMTNSDLSLANSSSSCGNYDNLQNLWNGLENNNNNNNNNNNQDSDSPTRPVIWLSKLCEGLPTSPQKCGSLPRSFQINPSQQTAITKSRFLQRDGKPMTERPFTIASDKPAEINLEDMERYASNYQPEGRIAKFPTSSVSGTTTSSSSYSCSIDDNLTDANHMTVAETDIHPDHKIYRLNSGNKILKNVLSKAGSRLQGLKLTASSETLESVDDYDARGSSKRHVGNKVNKKKHKSRLSRESSTDIDEPATSTQHSSLSYKQGSSGLGARIAQADYADPSVLFFDTKRPDATAIVKNDNKSSSSIKTIINSFEMNDDNTECAKKKERNISETDSFYEKCFETIENYIDTETDDAFRDSAIFSDGDEGPSSMTVKSKTVKLINDSSSIGRVVRAKIAPPVPVKHRKLKPSIARKPDNLKMKVKIVKKFELVPQRVVLSTKQSETTCNNNDVSMMSQAGWVKKIVGQLQGQIET